MVRFHCSAARPYGGSPQRATWEAIYTALSKDKNKTYMMAFRAVIVAHTQTRS